MAILGFRIQELTVKIIADQNIPFVKECFEHLGEVQLVAGRDVTPAMVADADALLVRSVTQVNELLLAGSSVKFVATATIGVDHIDQDYLAAQGIGFASAPGSNANSVAEWVVAALLTVAEKYNFVLAGKSIGIVGVGNVGSRVEAKCRALGLEVRLNDPPLSRETGDRKYRPLEELYDCDIVTFHTPLTKEGPDKTVHLAGADFFAKLKPGAIFINSSRGGVHDTQALHRTMDQGRLQAVILDVWENEPTIDTALLERVDLASPHIAGYSYDGKIAGLIMIYEALCEHFHLIREHTCRDFLPEPLVPEIVLDQRDRSLQPVLRSVVKQVYDIEADDRRTRDILSTPAEQQGAFFDGLRKNYPVRREFQNTVIRCVSGQAALIQTLQGIGFQVDVNAD